MKFIVPIALSLLATLLAVVVDPLGRSVPNSLRPRRFPRHRLNPKPTTSAMDARVAREPAEIPSELIPQVRTAGMRRDLDDAHTLAVDAVAAVVGVDPRVGLATADALGRAAEVGSNAARCAGPAEGLATRAAVCGATLRAAASGCRHRRRPHR